ncbi:hypothetical protein GA0115233_103638 [Streptomyces sp. DI166]|nr:hypothetical protein GA0115233_103638 [Streptomyces sp. DI166]
MTSSMHRPGRTALLRERSLLCTARDLHQHRPPTRMSSRVPS